MDVKQIREQLIAQIRLKLRFKTDDELLDLILYQDKDSLNNQIKDGDFPAWDIAYRLKTNGWEISPKQKKALINTLTYYLTDKVIENKLIKQT